MGHHQDRLTRDMKAALKAGDKRRLQVLRMLINDLKERQLRSGVDDLPDEDEIAVLQKAVKTRRDSADQARAAGREEMAAAEEAEIAIVQEYLPSMMSPDEVAARVAELAAELGCTGPSDTGRFMKEWMARYKGRAEGRDVQAALRARFGK